MHTTSGRWQLGLLMALTTALMWGVLPVALTGVMAVLDPVTVTFMRFAMAAAVLTPYLILRRQLPNWRKLLSAQAIPLLFAGLLLAGNYVFYIIGLQKTTSEAAQVTIQIAPMLLLLSGVWLFGERFSLIQGVGFVVFVCGLGLFFHHRLETILGEQGSYGWGIWIIVFAAVLWTGYGILQKKLLREFHSEETMMVFYWVGALVFLPISDLSHFGDLSGLQWGMLIFCGANTLIAYGCFAEAMQHWETSRVSATVTLAPLFTVALVQMIPMPGIEAEVVDGLSLIGAMMVVCGSMVTALARR